MSKSLPYSRKDVDYDNAKFRPRSFFKVDSFPIQDPNALHLLIQCF